MPISFPERFQAVAEALAGGATLLTANQRLSRHLRGRFDAYQAERGLEVWPSAEILPFSTWLGRCWEEGLNAGVPTPAAPSGAPARLLSQSQALIVWEKAIAADMGGHDLLQPSAAARLAAEARQMLKAWRLELPPCAPRGNAETAAFLRWRDAYEAACAKGGWVDAAQLPEVVGSWLAAGHLAAPAHVMLAGFEELTPQQNALLQTLAAAGTELTHLPMPGQPAPAVRVPCRDVDEEIETAARWARRLLEDGTEGSIAIVAPELGRIRGRVLRIFSDVLAPAAVLPGARQVQPVNISQGRPLAHHTLVDAALFLLGLWREPLESERITRLLLSPYLAGAGEEAGARAMLDAHLRALGEPERPLSAVIGQARAREFRDAPSPHHAPLLAGCLSRFKDACDGLRGSRRPPSGWAQAFTGLLAALGWPDHLRLGSEERQTWEKLMELFSSLAELDVVLPRITMGEAIARLSRLAADTQFQPESGPAQVQILGALEAGGLTFDRLWVLGLHDEAWPPPARPNPFLPSAWQREHDLPQSSATREADYARRVTARLLASAEQVVVSHPRSDGERTLRPSRLISELPAVEPGSLALSGVPGYWSAIRAGAVLETVDDHAGPPLETDHASGGTGIFKDQAACPFRAFANHRLHAKPLETPAHGLDPAERGGIVHKVMERLWARLESSTMLNSLEPQGLRTRVAEAVEDALSEAERRFPATLRGSYRRLEGERLMRLVLDYLEHEKGRAPFTVQAREAPASLSIGGIEVNTRVDRIDRLEDDRHVVIDYKTGQSDWRDWFGARPEEPQLPLYCASGDLDVAAVVFAQIRRGDSGFRGLQAEPGILPRATGFDAAPVSPGGDAPPTRATVLDGWKSALDALGDRFRGGAAAVDPRDGLDTCKYCELTPLCRIHERARWSGFWVEGGDER